MLSALSRWFGKSPKPAVRPRQARLEVMNLEERLTPTVYAYPSYAPHINTATALDQFDVATASNQAGTRVAVWTHQYSTTDLDIYAQRYNRLGTKIGAPIVVASASVNEFAADVAVDAQGWFYVAYTKQASSTNKDIYVARYNSSGVYQGFTTVAASTKNEYDPSISVSPQTGSFVVSYTLDFSSTDQDVQAKVYTYTGGLITSISVAATSASDETKSDVARSQYSSGNTPFAIAYAVNDRDVYVKRYSATGAYLGTTTVANSTNFETNPSIAANIYGTYAVAWQAYVGTDWDIYARHVFNTGLTSGSAVVQSATSQDTDPSIAIRNDADFVVGYQRRFGTGLGYAYVTEMNYQLYSAATQRATYLLVYTATNFTKPSLAIDSLGYYTIAYQVYGNVADSRYGVFGRLGYLA
jgi:hypothetical protein